MELKLKLVSAHCICSQCGCSARAVHNIILTTRLVMLPSPAAEPRNTAALFIPALIDLLLWVVSWYIPAYSSIILLIQCSGVCCSTSMTTTFTQTAVQYPGIIQITTCNLWMLSCYKLILSSMEAPPVYCLGQLFYI